MRGSRRSCDSFICFLASDALFSLFFFLRSSLEMGAPRESASTLRGAESKHDFFSTHVVFASSMEKKETYRVERPNRSECSPAFSPSSSNVEGTFSLIDSEETVDPVHPVVHIDVFLIQGRGVRRLGLVTQHSEGPFLVMSKPSFAPLQTYFARF